MNKKMPKTLYVKWEDLGLNEKPYLAASENFESHAVLNEKHLVGTYQLMETNYAISETKQVPARNK